MNIIAHRGFWLKPEEKNSEAAFKRAFENGFGVETDLRQYDGRLIVSHDPPVQPVFEFARFLELAALSGTTLAINTKEDGLAPDLAEAMNDHPDTDWFAFDMAVPDMLPHFARGLPTFTRISDIEPEPVCEKETQGVWLDAFYGDWWSLDVLDNILATGKRLAIVSPELHGRDYQKVWKMLANWDNPARNQVLICTDHPDKCREMLG